MSTRNTSQVGPGPSYPEVGGQVYDVTVSANSAQSRGPRYAEEQLVERGNLRGAFAGGYNRLESEQRYLTAPAGGRSPLADGSAASRGPAWDMVRPEEESSFASAADFGDPGQATPYPFQPRSGFSRNTVTPLDGLARGERRTRRCFPPRPATRVTGPTQLQFSGQMMSVNNYHFSRPGSPEDDVHGTSWILNDSGTGKRSRPERAAGIRAHQMIQPVPQVQSPLRLDMVREIVADYELAEATRPHTVARVVGGVIGYKIVRHVLKNRGR